MIGLLSLLSQPRRPRPGEVEPVALVQSLLEPPERDRQMRSRRLEEDLVTIDHGSSMIC
jgi:hypothetical protein